MGEYSKKLIDIIGKDTGFILSSGCTVPADCKYDNFKMMIDTAKNYLPLILKEYLLTKDARLLKVS